MAGQVRGQETDEIPRLRARDDRERQARDDRQGWMRPRTCRPGATSFDVAQYCGSRKLSGGRASPICHSAWCVSREGSSRSARSPTHARVIPGLPTRDVSRQPPTLRCHPERSRRISCPTPEVRGCRTARGQASGPRGGAGRGLSTPVETTREGGRSRRHAGVGGGAGTGWAELLRLRAQHDRRCGVAHPSLPR